MNKLDQRTYLAKPVSEDGTTADGPREVKIQGRNNNNNNDNNNTVPLLTSGIIPRPKHLRT